MKKILAIAAVAALTAGVSAYAANPFSDVSTSDWAYQAVSDLSDQGIVEGYPDGTFKGQQNMTRYELAQIIARLMAKEDQLNAEQRATVDKLASQFADELANLGVRVANVEKKLGNVSFTGDARLKYDNKDRKPSAEYESKEVPVDPQHTDGPKKTVWELKKGDSDKGEAYTARIRLNATAKVSDQVTVKGRIVSNFNFVNDDENGTITLDRLHVVYKPAESLTLDAGRTDMTLGNAVYDDTFDGVIADFGMGQVDLQAGYGRAREFAPYKNAEFAFAQAGFNVTENVKVGGFYAKTLDEQGHKFWGFSANADVEGFSLNGDYVVSGQKQDDKTPEFWNVGLSYGEVDTDKVGSFTVGVHYYDVDADPFFTANGAEFGFINAKFWEAQLGVAVLKNVELNANYGFNAEDKTSKEDLGTAWNVSLNYKF